MAIPLSNAALDRIRSASVPGYDRSTLVPGILHFGVGNFHRSHQALYVDRLLQAGGDRDWAIVGAGVMDGDRRMYEALSGQDWLTTVVEQSADRSSARVTGAMVDMVPVADSAAILGRLRDPSIRIVSLTVTEGGYFIDAATGAFNPGHPAIAADAATPQAPRTVFGLIAEGLRLRREAGVPAFTVMCCDNIPHNGKVTRDAVVGTARLSSPGLADWIAETVAFPNAMVDRITPATGDRERAILRDEFGIDDAWPVFSEDFTQWVMEDVFPAGRPALERVGVQFCPDVAPFELMKLRILNGGHAVIAYPAGLLGIHFVHEAMAHPLVSGFLAKVTREEILPTLPPVPGTDLEDYRRRIETRFANPKIGDTVNRLCFDGSNRQPKFILPAVADRLAAGAPVTGLALESALWCRYCHGVTEAGREIAPNDPNWTPLTAVARAARDDPRAWLGMEQVYGDIGRAELFAAAFETALKTLWAEGTEAVLARYVAGDLGA